MSKTKRLFNVCQQGWYWLADGSHEVYVAMTDWRPVVLNYTDVWVGLMLGACIMAVETSLEHFSTGMALLLCSLASIKIMLGCSDQHYVRVHGNLLAEANMVNCAQHAVDYLKQRSQDPSDSEWSVLTAALNDLRVRNKRALQDLTETKHNLAFRIQVGFYEKYQTLTQCFKK